MAGSKRKEPKPLSADQGASKKPKASEPPKSLRKLGSRTSANGIGVRKAENGFFNDEEAWIKIYYTLLARQAVQQVEMPISPTTDSLLLFNAYFQGFKEPIGKSGQNWDRDSSLLECVAEPTRTRRNLVDFETAMQRVCPELKTQINGLRAQRPDYVDADDASADASSLFVTPEEIASVLAEADKLDAGGNPVMTALDNLSLPDPTPADIDLWGDKAVARISARETRTSDDHPRLLDYKTRHWNPQDVPATSLRPGPQMVNRHEDAAYANALINACTVPPLGFFGDLKELEKQDFSHDQYDGQERNFEQAKHKEQVRIMRLSRTVHQARRLLASCKDAYGPLDKLFSIEDIVGYLKRNTEEEVEKLYEDFAEGLRD